MGGVIFVFSVAAIIAAVIYELITSIKRKKGASSNLTKGGNAIADQPIDFGYNCVWFAVKSDNPTKVADAMKINNPKPSGWKAGIDQAYKDSVFIAPSIGSWVLACGLGLPIGDDLERIDKVKTLLNALSSEFGQAQYFCTNRITEYHCWIKAERGQIKRVYCFSGEIGENLCVEGNPTPFEKKLNLVNTFSEAAKDEHYVENESLVWPDEDLVMEIAGKWSIDPSKMADRKDIAVGLGLIGKI